MPAIALPDHPAREGDGRPHELVARPSLQIKPARSAFDTAADLLCTCSLS
jgi:hypothetical protein